MFLNFIFSHLNLFAMVIWMLFFSLVVIRFIRPLWVKNISYKWLILTAVMLHLFYGAFVTWGQHHVWATGSDFTKALLASPLSLDAPLPGFLEFMRPHFGYFSYYALGRFFLNIFMLFSVSGLLYFFFKMGNKYNRRLGEHGPELLLVLMLIAGWPGVLLLIPFALFLSLASFILPWVSSRNPIMLEGAFLIAVPFAFFLARPILSHFNLLGLISM